MPTPPSPPPLRLGIDALRVVPCTDGRTETLLRNLLPSLAAAFPEDTFLVFGNRENRLALAEDLRAFDNVTFVSLPVDPDRPGGLGWRESFRFVRAARHCRLDALWAPSAQPPRGLRIPIVATAPALPASDGDDDGPVRDPAILRALRRADLLAAPSEFARQSLLRRTNVRFDRIAVIPPCADDVFGSHSPAEHLSDRMMALLRGADPYLMCIADSKEDAGLAVAVEAFGKLSGDLPHRLVLVGRPADAETSLREAVAALPDPSRVIRLGYVARDDLAALLQSASAYLEPALHADGAFSLLEAMCARVPVVATRAGAIPEIGGESLRYVPPDNPEALADAARETILLPLEERAEIVRTQAERAQKFTGRGAAEVLMSLFRRLVGADQTDTPGDPSPENDLHAR